MTTERDFDQWLKQQLQQPEVPDTGFTRALVVRMDKHRRHRRKRLLSTAVAAAIVIMATWQVAIEKTGLDFNPIGVALMLVLAAICSIAWIEVEAGS